MHRTTILLALATVACTPLGKNAGAIDTDSDGAATSEPSPGDTDPSDADDGATSAGPPVDEPVTAAIPIDAPLVDVVLSRSSGGVLVATPELPVGVSTTLREYSPDLELLWTLDFPDATVVDLNQVGDGSVASGFTRIDDELVPTAWRLSCCGAIEHTLMLPDDGGSGGSFGVAVPQGDGIVLVRSNGDNSVQLVRTDDELEVEWTVDPGLLVLSGATGPADTVVLDASEGGGAWLTYEVLTDGTGDGVGLGERLQPIGAADSLGLLGQLGTDTLTIRPYTGVDGGGGAVSTVESGPLTLLLTAFDGREHYAFASETLVVNGSSSVQLIEFDASGSVSRNSFLLPPGVARAWPMALAVGNDDGIYIAVGNSDELVSPDEAAFLMRVEPQ